MRDADDQNLDQLSLLDDLAQGVVLGSADETFYINKALKKILGISPEENGPADWAEMDSWIHPSDLPMLKDYRDARMHGNDVPENYEIRLVRTDGTVFWASCSASLTQWNGQKASLVCIRDISQRKGLEDSRARSEEMFRNVFQLTPEVMMILSLEDGKLHDVNPEFLNVFGHRRDDVIGKTTDELRVWADPMFMRRFVEELKMTASMTDVPATVRSRGNVIRHFRLFAQKIETGVEPLLLLIGRDITEDLVQAEELQRSRDMAELANRAKSEFLANMSHELRTPLNAILGFAEILRDQIMGPIGEPKYVEYAKDIHSSGNYLLTIINDILDLSKVEAGKFDVQTQWLDPRDSLEMCQSLVQRRVTEARVTLHCEIADDIQIEADERLLKQICLNLLSNAIKFTPASGDVNLTFTKRSDGSASLVVSDTGIGMSEKEVRIAQTPFGQIESALSRSHRGTGLGLPLVSAFAEKLGARLLIDSKPNEGTTVSVTFPAHKVRPLQPTESLMI